MLVCSDELSAEPKLYTNEEAIAGPSANDQHNGWKAAPLYENHIPISPLQRTILAVGSSWLALSSPARGGNRLSHRISCWMNEYLSSLTPSVFSSTSYLTLCLSLLRISRYGGCQRRSNRLLCTQEHASENGFRSGGTTYSQVNRVGKKQFRCRICMHSCGEFELTCGTLGSGRVSTRRR